MQLITSGYYIKKGLKRMQQCDFGLRSDILQMITAGSVLSECVDLRDSVGMCTCLAWFL